MKVTAAKAIRNADYRELTVAEGGGKLRFETLTNAVYTFDADIIPTNEERVFSHKFRPWMKMEPRRITIAAGYAWNGNSPKRGYHFIRDWWFGTPDFQGTIRASLLHDLLFQFSFLASLPFTLANANECYYQLAKAHGHPLDDTYNIVLKICAARHWANDTGNLTCTTTYENAAPDSCNPI